MKAKLNSLFWKSVSFLAPVLLAASVVAADPWRNPYYAAGGIGGTGIQSDDRGIGGTGVDNGIGGTGSPVYKDERGIGGTGIDGGIGGTGIIGTITGFGSIIVNGARVAYDDALPVESLDGTTTPQEFRIGHVVALETIERNGVLHASHARIRFPVAGQITNVDTRRNRLQVLDSWVQMSPDVLINDDANPDQPPILGIGDYVQVSGLTRPDGIIDASRVERRATGRARIVGNVTSTSAYGFTVGRRQFAWPNGQFLADVKPGRRVVVTGRYKEGRLVAKRLRVRPRVPFNGRFRRVLVEGFALQDRQNVRVRGLTINPRAVQSNTNIFNRRVIVGGVVQQGNRLRATTFRLPSLRELRRQDRQQRRFKKRQRRLEKQGQQQFLTPKQQKRWKKRRIEKREEAREEADEKANPLTRKERRKLRKQRRKERDIKRENRRRKKQRRRREDY